MATRFRAIFGKFAQLWRRRWVSWRLGSIAAHDNAADAEKFFAALLARGADGPQTSSWLTGATLRAARVAEARRRWMAASRLWVWYARASGDAEKASRNIIRCARASTQARNDRAAVAAALQCWKGLVSIAPNAPEARQGIAWCRAALARMAELDRDWAAARAHWSAVLEIKSDDPAAIEGVRRVQDAEAAAPEKVAQAHALYEQLSRATRPEHDAQCGAAKLLLEAGAPAQGLEFVERALAKKRSTEALLLLFGCGIATADYERAAAALNELAGKGDASAVPAAELSSVLSKVAPQQLSREATANVAAGVTGNAQIQAALLPHLLAHGLRDEIAAVVDAAVAGSGDWPEFLVLETARDLINASERERALRLLARFSAMPKVAMAFAALADIGAPHHLAAVLVASLRATEEARLALSLGLAEYYATKADYLRAISALSSIEQGGAAARPDARQRDRLGLLVAEIAAAADPAAMQALARFVIRFVSNGTKTFFSDGRFSALCDDVAKAWQFQHAPNSSRMGRFREGYFAHYMERRENQSADSFSTDFAVCEAALRYFPAVARLRPVERIPVSAELRTSLTQASLCLPGARADVLMSYAILRDRPNCDLSSRTLFGQLADWYLSDFIPGNHVPSGCIGPEVIEHFNTVTRDYSTVGVAITRFARFMQRQSESSTRVDALKNPLGALLFCLEAIPLLAANPHYRPFFAAIFPTAPQSTLADMCIAVLSGREGMLFRRSLRGESGESQEIERACENAPQDILVIGHSGQGTGLSRNFRMLVDAFAGGEVALATLAYETEAGTFSEKLVAWRTTCRSKPIVVAAVNAHDLPMLFLRDRDGVLDTCHVIGFFLWETSHAPRVQHLGIALVDEIWTPTRYVAEVYAPLARTSVVGKGLFAPEAAQRASVQRPGPLQFLTVFDFHSSIERKNPLASVLAFRRAFPDAEDVELILKVSNVNPQHPGNAFGQWERICGEAAQDSRIRIVAERYSEGQMKEIIAQAGCVVSLHRSEGFGYVLSDAMAAGVPVIATAHSGNLDFCDVTTSFPVACRLVPVKALGAHWETDETVWAEPDIESAAAQMRRVYEDYPAALRVAAAGQQAVLAKYATTAFAARLRQRIAAIGNAAGGIDRARGPVQ